MLNADGIAPPQPTDRPAWLASVCLHRQEFQDTALVVRNGDIVEVFKFVFAYKKPYHAMFQKLSPIDEFVRTPVVTSENWEELAMSSWRRRYSVEPGQYRREHELGWVRSSVVSLVRDLVFTEGSCVCSDAPDISLADFVKTLPEVKEASHGGTPATQGAASSSSSSVDPSLAARYGWLAAAAARAGGHGDKRARGSTGDGGDEENVPEEGMEPLDDDAVQDVFDELYRKREEWLAREVVISVDFRGTILGGAWTKKHKGVAYDAYAGKACNQSAKAFCRMYGLGMSARFALSTCSEKLASVFARAWCEKMQFFFDVYKASGDERYIFTADDVASFEETAGFSAAFEESEGVARERAEQVRALRPHN